MNAPITVIIAAYRAEATITASIQSALSDALVGEVLVIDDASPDATAAVAQDADDGSGRLKVLIQPTNAGPAAGRNRGLNEARGSYVAVLDADDLLLPGRFAALLALPAWDFAADNILFVPAVPPPAELTNLATGVATRQIALEEFIFGNISVRGRGRSELGFLKPVMRREFLALHRLCYDERLRLGEDFILYVQALAKGARFLLSERCGYLALERSESLSGRHSIENLEALRDVSAAQLGTLDLSPRERQALVAQVRSIAVRAAHRQVLSEKASGGIVYAIRGLLKTPALAPAVGRAVLNDKLSRPAASPRARRLLF
ncbi:MAG: glycosyl transferase [Sphingomonas bacterium]|nr:glycosyl transferase [Sphingomonas bacterium]